MAAEVDAELAADLVNVNRFEAAQLTEVATMVLELLRDPRGSAFQERLGAFAAAHGVNAGALKNVSRGLIVFFRSAAKNNLLPPQVAEDCLAMGLTAEAAATIRAAWEGSFKTLASNGVRTTIMANQLVDMEWKFGVTACSGEVGSVGSTFLHMKLVVDKGHGVREDVFMELTLPQFYEFMADMEKAKTFTDFLSS